MANFIVYFWLICFFSMPSLASEKPFSGTLVVVNKKGDTVNFIDLESREIKYTRRTGKGPHELAMSADGKIAVVTNYSGGNSLTVFDVQQAKKINTIDLASYPWPHGVQFLNDQRRVAVSSEGSDSVVIVDVLTGKIDKVFSTDQKGSHMLTLPESSQRVYTTNMHSNTVSEIAVESGKLLRTLSTDNEPEAIAVNKAGTVLWVGSNEKGLVTIFDLQTGQKIKQWGGFRFPYRVLFSSDERIAVIPDYRNNTLDIIDVKNHVKLRQLQFDRTTGPKGVVFHPNNQTLFMSAYSDDKVKVIDVKSGNILFELPTGSGPDGIGYSSIVLP